MTHPLVAPIECLIAYHEKYAKNHVSSRWIYGENMMVVDAYKKVLKMIDELEAAAPLPTAREPLRLDNADFTEVMAGYDSASVTRETVMQRINEWIRIHSMLAAPQPVSEGRLREALKPFAEFGQYLLDHPRKGISEEMYGWDNAVFIRKSDLIRAAELERALESA